MSDRAPVAPRRRAGEAVECAGEARLGPEAAPCRDFADADLRLAQQGLRAQDALSQHVPVRRRSRALAERPEERLDVHLHERGELPETEIVLQVRLDVFLDRPQLAGREPSAMGRAAGAWAGISPREVRGERRHQALGIEAIDSALAPQLHGEAEQQARDQRVFLAESGAELERVFAASIGKLGADLDVEALRRREVPVAKRHARRDDEDGPGEELPLALRRPRPPTLADAAVA